MEGIVIAIDAFFASGEIVPPVAEKDAVLVAHKSRVGELKKIVSMVQ